MLEVADELMAQVLVVTGLIPLTDMEQVLAECRQQPDANFSQLILAAGKIESSVYWSLHREVFAGGAAPDLSPAPPPAPTAVPIAIQYGTQRPAEYLPSGYLTVADPQGGRLLQLDRERYIVWELQTALLEWFAPRDMIWLGSEGILLVDSERNAVREYQYNGQLLWQYPSAQAPYTLGTPVQVRRSLDGLRTLIVDQGHHQILCLSADQQIERSYGRKGLPGHDVGQLCFPNAVEELTNGHWLITDTGNHRVLEVDSQGKTVSSWGLTSGLNSPVAAVRQDEGSTLILDGGNERLVLFNAHGYRLRECRYNQGLKPRYCIHQPLNMQVLPNGHVIIQDAWRLMEIDPVQGQVVWYALLSQLRLRPNFQNPAPTQFLLAYSQQYGAALQERFSLKAMLEKVPLFHGAEEKLLADLPSLLQQVSFPPDEVIVRKGENGTDMYFINRGQVGVMDDEEDQPLIRMSEGDIFGEMALILHRPRAATIKALEYCELYRLEKARLDRLVAKYPRFAQRLKDIAEERLNLMTLREHGHGSNTRLEPALRAGLTSPDQAYEEEEIILARNETLDFTEFICIDRTRGRLMGIEREGAVHWIFGKGADEQLLHPQSVTQQDGILLIADTGQHRILELEATTRRCVRKLEHALLGILSPTSAQYTPRGTLLICDQGNRRLIEAFRDGRTVWEWKNPHRLALPTHAQALPDGTILICDAGLHTVQIITPEGDTRWAFGTPGQPGPGARQLHAPQYATQLPNGHVLIADTGNHRVLEVDEMGQMRWEFHRTPTYQLQRPGWCGPIGKDHIVIYHNDHRQMVEVNREGRLVWAYKLPRS